jgi:CubicO group peptidase (beta-lactamase class C family)
MPGRSILVVIGCFFLLRCEETPVLPRDAASDKTDTVTSPPGTAENYFPPSGTDAWETRSPRALHWNTDSLTTLYEFLGSTNTHGFIILQGGRIVTEKYWNNWSRDTRYPIASAGKSVTAFLIGLAHEKGLLNINDMTAAYLGTGWTSMPEKKEKLIELRHHLSMTTGLDESQDQCVSRSCLKYKADAGNRWSYHNGPYNLLHNIIETASGKTMNEFTRTMLAEKIGMKNWSWVDHTLELTTRDMARFGLLAENKGAWAGRKILADSIYFQSMIQSSSPHNKSYGYLWWLNGKSSYRVPGENDLKQGRLVKHAPPDMFAAMGKGDIKIYVVPSLSLVVVRHGDNTGADTFGPSSYDEALWRRLENIMNAGKANN